MFHQSRPEVPVVPSGSVVNIELDIKMVCDAYRDVVQSQLAEFILGAIGVQLELVFAQIGLPMATRLTSISGTLMRT